MKKSIIVSLMLLALVANICAQRYSLNKNKFDSHLYIPQYDDPYNPAISGICSFVVPGLGQIYCGETGRGIAFLGGYVGCFVLAEAGAVQITSNLGYNNDPGYSNYSNAGVGTFLLGLGGMAVVSIWSIIDAIHVAKVNNMYIQGLRKTSSLKLEMSPYMEQLSINNQVVTPVGMTMRVKF